MVLAQQGPEWMRWAAWAVLVVSLTTDVVDGALARKYQWVSKIGVYLDPAVDKIVLLSAFYQIMYWNWLPLWVPIVLMVRELLVNAIRSGGAMEGRLVPANWMGKSKALAMSLTVGTGYFVNGLRGHTHVNMSDPWIIVVQWMSYGTTALSVFFGFTFIYKLRGIFLDSLPPSPSEK